MVIEPGWPAGQYRAIGGRLWGMCECGKAVRVKPIFGTLHICNLPPDPAPRCDDRRQGQ